LPGAKYYKDFFSSSLLLRKNDPASLPPARLFTSVQYQQVRSTELGLKVSVRNVSLVYFSGASVSKKKSVFTLGTWEVGAEGESPLSRVADQRLLILMPYEVTS
jgi:hypothetical protein